MSIILKRPQLSYVLYQDIIITIYIYTNQPLRPLAQTTDITEQWQPMTHIYVYRPLIQTTESYDGTGPRRTQNSHKHKDMYN